MVSLTEKTEAQILTGIYPVALELQSSNTLSCAKWWANFFQLKIAPVWTERHTTRYSAVMVNAQRPCLIPSTHSAYTCLSLRMITGRVDCWCIKKHIWHVTQRPPRRGI